MKDFIKYALQAIFHSKKASAAMAGVLLTLLAPLASRIGWDLTQDQLLAVLGIIGTYILGQGLADAGKERAKLELAWRESSMLQTALPAREAGEPPDHT